MDPSIGGGGGGGGTLLSELHGNAPNYRVAFLIMLALYERIGKLAC